MAGTGLEKSSLVTAQPAVEPAAPVAAPDHAEAPPIVIKASSGWLSLGLREVWAFRGLLLMLAWRDVRVRYKQTALGFGWAILPPFMNMIAFSLVFGGLAKVPSQGRPYPLWSYAGLLPWLFFSQGASRGAASLVGSSGLVSKVYFPRIVVPLAAVLTPLVDLCFALVVLFGLMGWYGIGPGWGALALPALLLFAFAAAFAVALWFSALNVRYRDVGFGIAFLVQFWMYLSPVIYPVTLVPRDLRLLYALNPMTGVIDGFRWGLLGLPHPDFTAMAVSGAAVGVLLLGGLVYFKRTERTFVDIL
jgi:lipopolysaccharide transport system permease protein